MKLNKLKSLAQAATGGPWVAFKLNDTIPQIASVYGTTVGTINFYRDQEYIAEADPETILKMIELIESQNKRIQDLEYEVETGDSAEPWTEYDEDFSND